MNTIKGNTLKLITIHKSQTICARSFVRLLFSIISWLHNHNVDLFMLEIIHYSNVPEKLSYHAI